MDERAVWLDGNAAGGILQALFGLDMTMALGTCGACAAQAQVAELRVYIHGMGTIVRCARCDNALIRITQVRGQTWLDLSGMRCLLVPAEA